jgi:dissimilatory sulfite reductase (desulfoviridin) alpha/beta subunit
MEWTPEAEAAIKKVPFFVRKHVRTRVEKEAAAENRARVSLVDVKATKARYLTDMKSEVKGYQLDTCFGPSGCPNQAQPADRLMRRIEALLKAEDLLGFLQRRVRGDLKFHHEFRATIAECPNACSQPQIKDIGIIGACAPRITEAPCSACNACVDVCKENAVFMLAQREGVEIDHRRCVACGSCIPACPTGTLAEGRRGYRVQIGGKLGRHPVLAYELPGIYDEDEVIEIVRACIGFYKTHSRKGQRFAQILQTTGVQKLIDSSDVLRGLVSKQHRT